MYTILIGVGLGFLAALWYRIKLFYFAFPVLGGVFGLTAFLIIGLFATDIDDFRKYKETYELVSLQSGVSSEGTLFIGTGSIRGTKRYFYYVKTKRGTISRSVRASNTYIEEGTDRPRITKVRFEGITNNWHAIARLSADLDEYKRIYIPEGSIKEKYKPN